MHKYNFFIFTVLIIFILGCISVAFACEKTYTVVHKNGLYIVEVNLNKATVKPYISPSLEIVSAIAKKTNANIAINTGFFDARNKKTVSFITENGEILANPQENENLTNNKELQPYLEKIYNRGELRIYSCNNKIKADIANHFDPLISDCELINSTQAGPIMLPDMNLEKEFFILKKDNKIVRDGAGMTRKTDRSAVALKGNNLYFIINDENTPLTIFELRNKLNELGFEQAMGFDGGGSVSLFVKQKNGIFYQDREEKNASRAIKSALIVK